MKKETHVATVEELLTSVNADAKDFVIVDGNKMIIKQNEMKVKLLEAGCNEGTAEQLVSGFSEYIMNEFEAKASS